MIFFSENCTVVGIMCNNMARVGEATDDNITRRLHFACWITKATHTLIICSTYFFSTARVVTRTLLSVRLYVLCLSCITHFLICCMLFVYIGLSRKLGAAAVLTLPAVPVLLPVEM